MRHRSRAAATVSMVLSALLAGTVLTGPAPARANHPVLVEGNCDSPVPGTTIVNAGDCGDFDGDGRIGTAEDTDGADRIFGTISAALGPGTGAAAGTGANQNGTVTIVRSGRFAEALAIGAPAANPGNVTLEAAPGVVAEIDAVLQGDPAGQNNARQGGLGITVQTPSDSYVILRNLVVRNYQVGVRVVGDSAVTMDNVRVENNRDFGILVEDDSQVAITNSQVVGNGFRDGTADDTPAPGTGVEYRDDSRGFLSDTTVATNKDAGLRNATGDGADAVKILDCAIFDNSQDIVGPVDRLP